MAESTVSKADFLAQLKKKTAQPKGTEPKATEQKTAVSKPAQPKPKAPEPAQPKTEEIRLDTPEGLSETVAALLARARKENQSQSVRGRHSRPRSSSLVRSFPQHRLRLPRRSVWRLTSAYQART